MGGTGSGEGYGFYSRRDPSYIKTGLDYVDSRRKVATLTSTLEEKAKNLQIIKVRRDLHSSLPAAKSEYKGIEHQLKFAQRNMSDLRKQLKIEVEYELSKTHKANGFEFDAHDNKFFRNWGFLQIGLWGTSVAAIVLQKEIAQAIHANDTFGIALFVIGTAVSNIGYGVSLWSKRLWDSQPNSLKSKVSRVLSTYDDYKLG